MSGYCFYIYPPPLDVSAHGHSFLNNGLDNTEWASFIPGLHTKLIINMGVPGFVTGPLSSFWAVDEPLASYMMVHFRVFGFQK